jgi:hypothetical protein
LREYKEIITNTTSDLEDHLEEINNKLNQISLQGSRQSEEDSIEQQRIQEEKASTQKCLDICAQVYKFINQIQLNNFENISTPSEASRRLIATLSGRDPAHKVTGDTFNECKETITNATTQLEKHLQDIDRRLQNPLLQTANRADGQSSEQEKIQEEINSIKDCLAICNQASKQVDQDRINVFEDVVMSDDGQQVIVSTIGDLISAKRITAGSRSIQIMGQLSDESVQQLSRDFDHFSTEKNSKPHSGGTHFETRHGTGFKLNNEIKGNPGGVPK